MAAERTDFVTDLPTASLATCLDLVRGNNPSARALGLAGENILSYACGVFIGNNPTALFADRIAMMHAVHATPAPTLGECEAAIKAVFPDPSGALKAGPVQSGEWLVILRTLLPFILGLLG